MISRTVKGDTALHRFIAYSLLLCLGFAFGFVTRDQLTLRQALPLPLPLQASSPTPLVTKPVNAAHQLQSFTALLEQQRLEEAIEEHQHLAQLDDALAGRARQQLLDQLQWHAARGQHRILRDLADTWLAAYPEDVAVWAQLVSSLQQTGEYSLAIASIDSMRRLGYGEAGNSAYVTSLGHLTAQAEEQLAGSGRMETLRDVYQELVNWGFDDPALRFRLGQLHIALGDKRAAQDAVAGLLLDPGWYARTRALLAPLSRSSAAYTAVALEERSGQYLANISLSHQQTVRLLLDTGASISALSEDAFESLANSALLSPRREQVLETAGGMVRARVYQLDSLPLGDQVVNNIEFAVLPELPAHMDGILGMNALGQIDFEIDQNASQLIVKGLRHSPAIAEP
jgi:clan AA aspartic protease (TIGR02281 family)